MSRILLVEDNRDFAATLAANLEREGYEIAVAPTGAEGFERACSGTPDLVILDLMLPGMSGYTVLQRLRDAGVEVPVLIMTARGTEDEKVHGFRLGADDYVVKPCGLREILARVRALLRRSTGPTASDRESVIRLDDLVIDLGARTVHRTGRALWLRRKEFDLLAALARHQGRVVSRDELLVEVWGYAPGTETRTVETHITALRHRLGDDPRKPRYIHTVRGAGYRLAGDHPVR